MFLWNRIWNNTCTWYLFYLRSVCFELVAYFYEIVAETVLNSNGKRIIMGADEFWRYSQIKAVLYTVQDKNCCLAASNLLHMFTQLSSIYSIIVKKYRCLKNVNHQIGNKNEWLLFSESFMAKFGLVFVLPLENTFS